MGAYGESYDLVGEQQQRASQITKMGFGGLPPLAQLLIAVRVKVLTCVSHISAGFTVRLKNLTFGDWWATWRRECLAVGGTPHDTKRDSRSD